MPEKLPVRATLADVARLSALLDHAPVAVYAKDVLGRYLYTNSWFRSVMGVHPRQAIVGRTDVDVFGRPAGVALRSRDVEFANEPVREATTDALDLFHGKRSLIVDRQLLYDDDGAVVGTFGIVADVTADIEIERYDSRFRALFAKAPHGMMVLAPDGRWLRVNAAFADRLGHAEEALVGHRVTRLLHPLEAGAIDRLLKAARESHPNSATMDVRFVSAHDGIVHFTMSASVLGDPGELGHVFLVHAVDQTELHRARSLAAEAVSPHATDRPQAVVVDDEQGPMGAIARIVEELGFDVFATDDARVALRHCQSRRPALLVTDLLMPLMAGEELISRGHQANPEMKVVCVSGFPPSRLPKGDPRILWLAKPLDADALVNAIEQLLPGRARAVTAPSPVDGLRTPPAS